MSKGEYTVFLCREDKCVAPISQRPRKIKRVVQNTLTAETMVLNEAAEQAYYIIAFMCELRGFNDTLLPKNRITDTHPLFRSIYSTKTMDDKTLLIDINCIRENAENLNL